MNKFLIQVLVRFSLVLAVVGVMDSSTAFAQTDSSAPETSQINPTEVQKALAEAGFYKGAIDGIIGRKTRAAIRAFQEKNGLTADGKCGPKTWEKLKAYLEEATEMDTAQASLAPSQESTSLSLDEEYDTLPAIGPEPKLENDELKQKLIS